jgi:hypothetical protein
MSSTENPIHAPLPSAPAKHHHLQKGDHPRIRLCNGPTVDQGTLADLNEWHRQGVSYGVLIDRLTVLAKEAGYNPVTQTYHKQTKSQKAGLAHPK